MKTKTISKNTRATVEGLVLLAREKGKEIDDINRLQVEVIMLDVELSESDQQNLKDSLMDCNWGEYDGPNRTTEILRRYNIEAE